VANGEVASTAPFRLAIEAVRKYPYRFAIMGWFYLDDPNGRDLVEGRKERPGMLGRAAQAGVNDRQEPRPAMGAAERAGAERYGQCAMNSGATRRSPTSKEAWVCWGLGRVVPTAKAG
jgi:hypothetical protein